VLLAITVVFADDLVMLVGVEEEVVFGFIDVPFTLA